MQKKILLAVGLATVISLSTVSAALAWHPEGKIDKKVQNVTTNSALGETVAAKPGDTLKYVIEVRNVAGPAGNEHNDMYYTVMEDKLPAGVELASNPSQRTIKEDLGRLQPGQKVTKEYLVKVTATQAGTIKNTACFTGDSKVRDNKQDGCNDANVTVTVPETPQKPEEPKKEVLSEEIVIPATGPAAFAAGAISLGAVGYGATAYVRSKRDLARAHKR